MRKQADKYIREEFRFFRRHALAGTTFTLDDLKRDSGRSLNDESWATYWSKKWSQFLIDDGDGRYAVRNDFIRLDANDFASVYRQAESLYADYELRLVPSVIVFEFFLPLTHERQLRASLDALFYEDDLRARVEEMSTDELAGLLRRPSLTTRSELVSDAIRLIGEHFGGYSIAHVGGRFRARQQMETREGAARLSASGRTYIVDETTATVRFIFAIGEERALPPDSLILEEPVGGNSDAADLAERIRGLLVRVFVQTLVRTVRYEDEVWLLESGLQTRLWRLVARKKDDLGDVDDLYEDTA